jgi:hypothetical protein
VYRFHANDGMLYDFPFDDMLIPIALCRTYAAEFLAQMNPAMHP